MKDQMKNYDAPIVVVGASLGGTIAAWSAAKNGGGRRVLLLESTDWIGGQLTSQAVPPDEHRWIGEQGLSPEVTVVTGAGGRAVHEPLAAGLYLLTAAPCQKGSYTYTAAPALVGLPLEQPGGGWQYAVTAAPKLERTGTYVPPVIIIPDNPAPAPADKLPQTGLLQWPIALLAAAGLVLLAVGGALRRRSEP